MRSQGPTQPVAPYSSARAALSNVSTIRLLLPEPLTPVTALIKPSGDLDGDVFQIVSFGAHDAELELAGRLALRGDRKVLFARQIGPGDRAGILHDLVGRALGDDLAAQRARARTHVDYVVRAQDGVAIVLDDQHAVALVDQATEGLE